MKNAEERCLPRRVVTPLAWSTDRGQFLFSSSYLSLPISSREHQDVHRRRERGILSSAAYKTPIKRSINVCLEFFLARDQANKQNMDRIDHKLQIGPLVEQAEECQN